MSNGRSRSLSSGGSATGSMVNIVIVALIVIVLVLCAGVFVLYGHDKSSSDDANAAKQSYSVLNDSYNQLSGQYTSLVAKNADLSARYNEVNTDYANISGNYAMLKNQSDATAIKLGEFMESNPTIAYNYKVSPNVTANYTANSLTPMDLIVTVYNVCDDDARNILVMCSVKSTVTNSTGVLSQSIADMPSLSKKQVKWVLDNTTSVESVWVAMS